VLVALKGGFFYFAIAFAAGFVLGTLRVLAFEPYLGATLAVMIELPIILAISWHACRRIVIRLQVPQNGDALLLMGGSAFVLLIAAEFILGVVLFGRTMSAFLATYQDLAGALGLLGQMAFGVFPVIQRRQKGSER
jgi:hypothetical protein